MVRLLRERGFKTDPLDKMVNRMTKIQKTIKQKDAKNLQLSQIQYLPMQLCRR